MTAIAQAAAQVESENPQTVTNSPSPRGRAVCVSVRHRGDGRFAQMKSTKLVFRMFAYTVIAAL